MAQPFDPAAATAAYLAALTPAQHAKAQAYTQGGHWLLLWGALVTVAAAWLILRSGVLVRLRMRLERAGPRPWRAVAAVVVVFAVLDYVLEFPWTAYAHWWRERQYGLTSQAFGGWFGEQVLNLAISTVMLTALVGALYLLIRRAPRTWWLWGGGVTALFIGAAFILGPVYIEPLFNTYKPAPPGPVRDAVVAMARANGVPSDKIYIYNGSKQSNRYTANVSGLFGTARVAMSDTMFQQGADLAEVKGVVGHEMGHYVLNHAVRDAALFALIAMAGFFLVDRLYPWALKLTGAQGVGGIADPAGYPVLMILFAVLGLLATPLTNTVSRVAEAEADSFSLERVNEPDGMAKALVKTIAYRAATPSKLEEVIFYDHPSVGSRVRKAMDWKAAHPKTVAPPLGELPRSG